MKKKRTITKARQAEHDAMNKQRIKEGKQPLELVASKFTVDRKVGAGGSYSFDYSVPRRGSTHSHLKSVQTTGKAYTSKQSITDPRSLEKESEEVRAEIIRKANSLAPAYSKGAYQYIGSVDAAKEAGKKNSN